jgi:hypothetical protein
MSTNAEKPKGIHEAFAQFFEKPTRPGLRKLLQQNTGEYDHIDFKEGWVLGPKLARHILGFANSQGGALVIGLKEAEDGSIVANGLPSFNDKTDLANSVKRFLPDGVPYEIHNFQHDESEYAAIVGRRFQVLLVDDKPENLPFVCLADGEGIRAGAVYIRDGVATSEASHRLLQQILNRRIATGHSTARQLTLRGHLDELKALYGEISDMIPNSAALAGGAMRFIFMMPNPFYPEEGYDKFIARAIEAKKKVIEDYLAEKRTLG